MNAGKAPTDGYRTHQETRNFRKHVSGSRRRSDLPCAAWRADGRLAAETRIHDRAGLWLRGSGGRGAPRWPRITGLGTPAGSDLLLKFAGLRIGPATAGGACPAFMRTRYSWSTVSTTAEPKTRLASLMANLGSQPILAERPLAARKRGWRSVAPHVVARARRQRKAGVSDRPSRRPASRRGRGPRSWRVASLVPIWARALVSCRHRYAGWLSRCGASGSAESCADSLQLAGAIVREARTRDKSVGSRPEGRGGTGQGQSRCGRRAARRA